jgi:ABC-type transport system involved in cytochrome c biogenesis ATPase subunit/uncharacterized Zn finger protein (UPF0148 family)
LIVRLPSIDDFLTAQKDDQEIIKQWESHESAGHELARLAQQSADYEKQLEHIATSTAQQETDYEALVSVTSGQESAHAAARSALGHWQSYKSVENAKKELQDTREAIAAKRLANVAVPSVPAEDLVAAQRAHVTLQKQLKEAEKFVSTFTTDGVVCCPTCKTPTTDLAHVIKKTQEHDVPKFADEIQAAAAEVTRLFDADAAYRQWEKIDQDLAAREQQLLEAEHKLVAVRPPPCSEDELQKTVNEYEEFQKVKKEIEPIVRAAREKRAKLNGLLDDIKDRSKRLHEQRAAISVTATDAALAEGRLSTLRDKVAERQTLEQQQAQAAFEFKKLSEQHDVVVQQENEIVRVKEWLHVAEQAREALKNAPRLVAQRNLLKLETSINELLQIFGVNFVVAVAGDGSPTFRAKFFDGRDVPAQRLSIGQKTVLALAFRVAVNAMFAEEIGLLALDEPTASLDAARIQALAPVLEKLRDLSTSKGLQCLLVTHASNLSHLFESVIELEAPELRHVRAD